MALVTIFIDSTRNLGLFDLGHAVLGLVMLPSP